MQATTPSIAGVFERSRILRIPFFQRQYVWEEKDWARFTDDMYSLIENETEYFLGALILKEETVDPSERAYGIREKLSVVDGQQRLTTLSIFMKVLHLLTAKTMDFDYQYKNNNRERTPILHHNINDRSAFNEIMNLECAVEDIRSFSNKNVVAAYRYFRNELMNRGQLEELLNAINAHICFVEIKLHQTDNEKQIFETINSLGVDLTTDELLKNFLYNPGEEEHYIQDWKPAFDDEEARKFWGTDDASRKQAKSDKTKTIETFILHFVKIQMWKYRDKFAANDRKRLVAKNDLFNSCKMFVNNYGEDRLVLANEIIEYSKLYKKYFDKSLLNVRIPAASSIERLACYAMAKETTIIPYLLYILRTVRDEEEQIAMFDYLERYLLRRIVSMPNSKNKNFVEFFSETFIGSETNSLEKLKNKIGGIDLTQNHAMPTDAMIDSNISSTAIDEETAKLFLYMLESRMSFRAGLGYNQYAIDAIMPKPGAANALTWLPHEDEAKEALRKTRAKSIGNYLLLLNDDTDNPINLKDNKNKSWENKVDSLKGWSRNVRVSQWFEIVSVWNEDKIADQNKNIALTVKTILSV